MATVVSAGEYRLGVGQLPPVGSLVGLVLMLLLPTVIAAASRLTRLGTAIFMTTAQIFMHCGLALGVSRDAPRFDVVETGDVSMATTGLVPHSALTDQQNFLLHVALAAVVGVLLAHADLIWSIFRAHIHVVWPVATMTCVVAPNRPVNTPAPLLAVTYLLQRRCRRRGPPVSYATVVH